jgi:CBS domain-containing protein
MQTAKEIMTTGVVTVKSTASIEDAMKLMKDNKIRDLLVEPDNDGDDYGILTEADIVYKLAAQGETPASKVVGDIMTKPCIEVDPELTVQEVAQLFANHHIHRAPVIKGELLGVVTAFDIVRETMWWQG